MLSMRFVEYVFASPSKFVDIGTADNRALHLDRRTDKVYLFYKWYALPDGYDADSVKELLVVSSNPVVLFDDGSVWYLRKDGMWYQSITLSKLGKAGKLLHIFKMTDPDYSDNAKTYDKLYVLLDDYRLYRVSMGKDMLVNYFSVYDEVR